MAHRTTGLPSKLLRLALVGCIALAAVPALAVDAAPRVKPRKGLRVKAPKGPRRPGAGRRPGAKGGGERTKGPIGVVADFAKGTPLWVLRQVFRCALDDDEGTGFDCYVKQNSVVNKGSGRALKHLRRYQWRHFRKWAPTYVLKARGFRLMVTRWSPKEYDGSTRDLRIYLRSRQRDNPAPVMLRREGGSWRVYANSL